MSAEIWGEAALKREQVNAWCAETFARYDLLVTPTVPYDPPPAKGPFPEEIGLTGPIVSGVNEILSAIKAGGDVGTTSVIPTVPEAEKAAARQLLEARVRDLYQ